MQIYETTLRFTATSVMERAFAAVRIRFFRTKMRTMGGSILYIFKSLLS